MQFCFLFTVSEPNRRVSLLANSTYSSQSKRSAKAGNPSTLCIPGVNQSSRSLRVPDSTTYEVVNENSSYCDKKQTVEKNKLLKKREQNKSQNISNNPKSFDLMSNVDNIRWGKYDQCHMIKESQLKSHMNDAMAMEHEAHIVGMERRRSLRTSVLRRQWNDRSRSPIPLTAKLLRDFTNSPEGNIKS